MHTDGTDAWEHLASAPDESSEDLWRSLAYIVSRYFHHPRYCRIRSRPVLTVFDSESLVDKFGFDGVQGLLDDLRALALRMGHTEGIHFHSCLVRKGYADLEGMGFDSYGFYNTVPYPSAEGPVTGQVPGYEAAVAHARDVLWPDADSRSALPLFPAASPGWDTSPRFLCRPRTQEQQDEWPGIMYWGGQFFVAGETPAGFKRCVEAAIEFVRNRPDRPQVVTIGCWNEWTEGQYLLPDTRFGYGMLEALAEARWGLHCILPATGYEFFGG
jgi:hypothetical protein